ncbi:hypothetical protein ACFLTW_05975 [Chloroflexota bacterium]
MNESDIKKIVKATDNEGAPTAKDTPPEWCAVGNRNSYATSGCAGGFYPACGGKNRFYTCIGMRL